MSTLAMETVITGYQAMIQVVTSWQWLIFCRGTRHFSEAGMEVPFFTLGRNFATLFSGMDKCPYGAIVTLVVLVYQPCFGIGALICHLCNAELSHTPLILKASAGIGIFYCFLLFQMYSRISE